MDREKRKKGLILLALAVAMALILILGRNTWNGKEKIVTTTVEKMRHIQDQAVSAAAVQSAPTPTVNPEDRVYSYFQGPKCWEEQREWSGKWGKEYHDGSSFGAFGCGFCCMANIYSTLTEYECTPLDIYEFSKKRTPYGGGGAIAWQFMRTVLTEIGFQVRLGEKPPTYDVFREMVEETQAMLVLVSSSNDDSYWKDTPGHYVTLFLYDRETDEVFLTDSGDPSHNRQRIPLKTVYKALKTSSDFQFISVLSYDRDSDSWKHRGAEGVWIRPAVLTGSDKGEREE